MNPEAGRAVPCAPRKWRAGTSPHDGAQGNARPTWLPAGLFCLLLAAVALAGCQSTSFSSYVSPRVTGRVVAADTHQPLAHVRIRRVNQAAVQNYDDPAKGGQKMESAGGVRTDQEGRFVFDAERDLTLLSQQFWVSVTLSFQREGYLTLQTNFTYANVTTNAPDGAPVVNAGDILLHPTSP
jgi:hypothetical protein